MDRETDCEFASVAVVDGAAPRRQHDVLGALRLGTRAVGGAPHQLHLRRARDNGLTAAQLAELITHLAFYAGWPKAMAAMAVAKRVFRDS